VSLDEPASGDGVMARLVAAFHALHERRYAYRSEDEVVELVQLRVAASGPEMAFPAPASPAGAGGARPVGRRRVFFTGGNDWREAPVWDRRLLTPDWSAPGPAVIEGEGSSTLVPPGWTARVDVLHNLDIRLDSDR